MMKISHTQESLLFLQCNCLTKMTHLFYFNTTLPLRYYITSQHCLIKLGNILKALGLTDSAKQNITRGV